MYKCIISKYGNVSRTIMGKDVVLSRFIKSLVYSSPVNYSATENNFTVIFQDIKYTEKYILPVQCKKLISMYNGIHNGKNIELPVVFINCKEYHFITDILMGQKLYETRNKNMLKSLVNRPVLLAETGKGKKPVVRGLVYIDSVIRVDSMKTWEKYRKACSIEKNSVFDWKTGTKHKYLYHMTNIFTCEPFTITDGIRHGRTWMEYTESKTMPLYLY